MRSEVEGRGTARHGIAGEVRQGSEAKGRDGRVEVRQEWSGEFVVARSGLARQAAKGAIRKGGTGGARTGRHGTKWRGPARRGRKETGWESHVAER